MWSTPYTRPDKPCTPARVGGLGAKKGIGSAALPLKIFYTDIFPIPLPEKHAFPGDKYRLLRSRITSDLGKHPVDMQVPAPAAENAILRTHDAAYVRRLFSGELTEKEIRRVGLPWSPEMVKRTRYSVGGTIAACCAALSDGVAANLGGGTHHAFHDHGQGFCWLNDAVIAARAMQDNDLAARILIVDCDVHQGNGTAVLARHDPTLFTFSIHGKNNFPYRKEKSDLDIELPNGTGDDAYLDALAKGLAASTRRFKADLAIYLAGADPYRKDRFGRLALSKAGLARRDRLVLHHLQRAGISTAVTLAGGYAPDVQDIVDIHYQTIETVLALYPLFKRR